MISGLCLCAVLFLFILKRKFILIGYLLFFFFIGITIITVSVKKRQYDWPSERKLYTGIIIETPKEKDKTYACLVNLIKFSDHNHDRKINKKVLVFIAKDSRCKNLKLGDKVSFMTVFRKIPHTVTINGFDYADYMFKEGVLATAYVKPGLWILSGSGHVSLLSYYIQSVKDWILLQYENSFNNIEERSILKAFTLGMKDDLTYGQKTMFSEIGASHLLALSGLHLGILYVLLNLALSFLWSYRSQKIKNIIILILVWLFTFMVGFSTSIVRASVMLTLFFLARCINRDYSTINILSWTAFFILVLNPFALYDVGFQLSFSAVLSILVLVPYFKKIWRPQNRIVNYLWEIVIVSVSAQIGVLPAVLYHFSTFPLYFLLTNLLAIPLVALILWITIFFLSSSSIIQVQNIVALFLSHIIKFMNHLFAVIESWRNSTIKYKITGMEVFIIILIFLLIVLYLKTRRIQWAYISVIFFSLFLIERSYSFSIFSLSPSIHFGIVEKKNHYIKFDYSRGKFDLYDINNSENCLGLASKEGIIRFKEKTVCVLSDKRWGKYISTKPLLVDYLYITPDYKGYLDEIGRLFIPKKVILDSSLSPYQELLLIKECKRLNVDFISLSEKGTYKISV